MDSLRYTAVQYFKVLDWNVVPSVSENLPQFSCRIWLSHLFLSPHVIPDWLENIETRALWGMYHLLPDTLLCFSLNIVLYDFGHLAEVIVVLQNKFGTDQTPLFMKNKNLPILPSSEGASNFDLAVKGPVILTQQ